MTDASAWPVVIVESPFADSSSSATPAEGGQANMVYLSRACLDCLKREEVPFASHGFFTRFLDDAVPEHRSVGITAGYAFWRGAAKVVFYGDLGMSPGMTKAMARALLHRVPVEIRYLDLQVPAVAVPNGRQGGQTKGEVS